MGVTDNPDHLFCNTLALEKGLDPAGYARVFDIAVALEIPLPWTRDILQDSALVPPELVRLVNNNPPLPAIDGLRIRPIFLALDDEYSVFGYRRVIIYSRPHGAFAEFDRVEYLVPHGEAGTLIGALYEHPNMLAQFDTYRADSTATRDIMICTHGSKDAACGKFGYPLYQLLRATAATASVRIWRVNHLGGHVFAPTLVDMPKGDYWGFANEAIARTIIDRTGDIQALQKHYRGWAGLPEGFLQAAERDILMREGWHWQHYQKQGIELARDTTGEQPRWADVRIEYRSEDHRVHNAYEAHVTVKEHLMTIPSTGKTAVKSYPQYHVERLQKLAL